MGPETPAMFRSSPLARLRRHARRARDAVRASIDTTREISLAWTHRALRGTRLQGPPIFIAGCGHSGTSLLLAMLGAHSRIFAVPGETSVGYLPERDFLARCRRFDRMTLAAGKSRWAEKTPKHVHCLDRILQYRPDAKIVIIIRDGRDVATSMQSRTGDLAAGIERWIADNAAGERYWNHPGVHRLRYEDIVDDFERSLRGLMTFLGEAFEPMMRDYHSAPIRFYSETIAKPSSAFGDNHAQYRNWQINQPLFDGRGRWRQLSPADKALVKQRAGDMLVRYGYTSDLDW